MYSRLHRYPLGSLRKRESFRGDHFAGVRSDHIFYDRKLSPFVFQHVYGDSLSKKRSIRIIFRTPVHSPTYNCQASNHSTCFRIKIFNLKSPSVPFTTSAASAASASALYVILLPSTAPLHCKYHCKHDAHLHTCVPQISSSVGRPRSKWTNHRALFRDRFAVSHHQTSDFSPTANPMRRHRPFPL